MGALQIGRSRLAGVTGAGCRTHINPVHCCSAAARAITSSIKPTESPLVRLGLAYFSDLLIYRDSLLTPPTRIMIFFGHCSAKVCIGSLAGDFF